MAISGTAIAGYATAAAAVVGAVASYSQGQKSAAAARDAAERQRLEAGAATQANAQAAEQAVKRDQAADIARRNEELAGAQMKEAPEVTISDGSEPNRLRKVKAAFNVDSTNGAGGAGSIRV